MIKSTLRIILLLFLTIGIGIGAFIFGTINGYKKGILDGNMYVNEYILINNIEKSTNLLFSLKHRKLNEIKIDYEEMLKSYIDFYLKFKDMNKEKVYFDYSFIKEHIEIPQKYFYLQSDLNFVQNKIKGIYTKKEIENTEVFKKFLDEDFSKK
jgi:hypothetical protein